MDPAWRRLEVSGVGCVFFVNPAVRAGAMYNQLVFEDLLLLMFNI